MTTILLQITQNIDKLLSNPSIHKQAIHQPMKLIEILMKEGIILIPIVIISFLVFFVSYKHYLSIRKYVKSDKKFMNNKRFYPKTKY